VIVAESVLGDLCELLMWRSPRFRSLTEGLMISVAASGCIVSSCCTF